MSTRILQIMPADGWRAIRFDDDGNAIDEILAAWVLVEESNEPEEPYQYLAGLVASEIPGLPVMAEEERNFAFYLPQGEPVEQAYVGEIAKRRGVPSVENKQPSPREIFDAIAIRLQQDNQEPRSLAECEAVMRRKKRAIEILSRNSHRFAEGREEALRILRSAFNLAANRAKDTRVRERMVREKSASRELAAEAEALAVAELADESVTPTVAVLEILPRESGEAHDREAGP